MAMMTAKGRASGRGRRGSPRYSAMADINMTPFIDVMLVLLIIFMVAAPLLSSGVPIDLPQTTAAPLNVDSKPVAVSIDDKGTIYLADAEVTLEQLPDKLKAAAAAGFDERIYVRGSKAVAYGKVAEVMTAITGAGYKKVALVTGPEDK
jgi:biopolymer transport protein TolR